MKRSLLLLISIIVFGACSSDDNGLVDEFTKNRLLWESYEIDDYKWNEHVSCFCAGPREREIFVVNAVKDTVTFDTTGIPPENLEEIIQFIFDDSKTIDEAFDFIDSLLGQNIFLLVTEYDQTYGFPTVISVDYDENIADDEFYFSYSGFKQTN